MPRPSRFHSNSLYLLVSVSQRVMFAHEGKPSYLDKCLSMSLVVLKRLVDKLVVCLVGVVGGCGLYLAAIFWKTKQATNLVFYIQLCYM